MQSVGTKNGLKNVTDIKIHLPPLHFGGDGVRGGGVWPECKAKVKHHLAVPRPPHTPGSVQ